ncbi:nucleotidyltransferase [Edaphobacillus lindanitolerans]|uniref:tRNA(Met) cytidine acetate ligase n=1 Tax=Edaphobacillus lindanitolerans TaxID=550447 RepID=A0A1U7PLN0_9BACI|nr:nucleotidyltransferase [Edaphobacillus lindanitolerans]SIT67948.1 Predicted nucleotidyltransferase [Edaphobacillus lindanitolerans]
MKAAGVVVEYNPLHNGHVHHLRETRKATGADVIIAAMSGNFLQRGEPAFLGKWERAELALRSGADLVFELPYRFATAQASEFAEGAVTILSAAGCSSFCFGSEDGDILAFEQAADLIGKHRDRYESDVRRLVRTGMSYPAALSGAYSALPQPDGVPAADLTRPNNILGYHYLRASRELGTGMKAYTIGRSGSGHHDLAPDAGTGIMSATGIRRVVLSAGTMDGITGAVPPATAAALQRWREAGRPFGSWDEFWPLLRYSIIREGSGKLARIAEMSEGFENRIFGAAAEAASFPGFMERLKTKRYTWTRIQRLLTHILCGMEWEDYRSLRSPRYLRLLGMTPDGRQYLNENKKTLGLPLVTRAAASDDPMLRADIRAADIYWLGIGGRGPGSDYRTPPILIGD